MIVGSELMDDNTMLQGAVFNSSQGGKLGGWVPGLLWAYRWEKGTMILLQVLNRLLCLHPCFVPFK